MAIVAIGVLILVLSPLRTDASVFYDDVVIGEIGSADLTDLGLESSINDKGQVAFVGFIPDPTAVPASLLFVGDGSGDPVAINPGFLSPSRLFTVPSINDAEPAQVFARDRVTGSPPIFLLRLWDTVTPNAFTLVARTSAGMICTGGLNVGKTCTTHADCECFGVPFPFCSPGFCTGPAADPFDGLLSRVAVNTTNQTAFGAFVGVNDYLVTGATPTFNQISLPIGLRPAMADDGSVVVRAGSLPTDPIRRYDYDLAAASDVIADSAKFTELGLSPGVSASGVAIVFAGTPSAGAVTLGTGRGVFLSLDRGGRELLRLTNRVVEDPRLRCDGGTNAGELCHGESDCPGGASCTLSGNGNGICESGEACADLPDLGLNSEGEPRIFDLNGFDLDTKVDVIHQELGDPGLAGDALIVTFIATPSPGTASFPETPFTAAKGLWTVRIDFDGNGRETFSSAIPVVQIGDIVASRVVEGITVSEPIARAKIDGAGNVREEQPGDHRLAFGITSGTYKAVIRAEYLDSDGDSLLDHWESTGLDMAGDGTIDLTLAGADPMYKDLFVEVDWMAQHEPFDVALSDVQQSFRIAPVPNPNGNPGIALHLEKGEEALAHQDVITFRGSPSDFDTAKAGHFGTAAERGDASAIAGKRLTHRYALFVHNVAGIGCSSGQAELPGNDFVVSLGCDAIGSGHPNGKREHQASTTMHELGHSLNLGHGGDQKDVNCKPNYLSVMNYSFQFDDVGPATGRPLDYSDEQLPDLDESNLSEPAGISGPPGRNTITGPPPGRVFAADGAIDWNRDGDGGSDASVSADVNNAADLHEKCNGFNGVGTGRLTGFNDWEHLQYDFRSTADFSDGVHTTVEDVEEESIEDLIAVSGDRDSDGVVDFIDNCVDLANAAQSDDDEDTIGNPCDNCPVAFNPGQEDSDENDIGDVCEGAPTPNPPTATPTSIPPTATQTLVPPTVTETPVPPTVTQTPVAPTVTQTPVPPTVTETPVPPTVTETPVPPTVTQTPVPPTVTETPVPPTVTSTAVAPTVTATPVSSCRDFRCGNGGDKFLLCHVTGSGRAKTLCIDGVGVADHLANHEGDVCGDCGGRSN